jgi:hypothetical protein
MAERIFKDNNGVSKVILEGNDAPLGGDFANNRYVIANHVSKNNSKKMKAPGIATDNIGIGSSGFAGVITLASIVAIAGVIIAFLTLGY